MRRGPRLARNQFLVFVPVALSDNFMHMKRLKDFMKEAWGKGDNYHQDDMAAAFDKAKSAQEVQLMVTVRRDGSKHYKVVKS